MRTLQRILLAAMPLFALATGSIDSSESVFAQQDAAPSNETIVPISAHRTDVELTEKFAKILETKKGITRVDGFDPVVLNVTPLTPSRIRISGLLQGVTTVSITDETGANFAVEVFVKGDARMLQAVIDKKFPNSSIEAFKVQDAVALRGWVTRPEEITQIVEIAEQFYPKVLNQMKVGGVQQVLLKVKVMEAQRSVIRQLGMNFTYLSQNGYLNSAPGSLNTLGNIDFAQPSFTSTSIRDLTASFGIVGENKIFNAYLTALRNEALLKILAEPELVAINGRPATLLSGGEFPILVPQSLGTVSVQWREFGVRLEAVPTVLGNGNLRLELQPEVSDRDFTNAVTVGGTTIPGLTVRRVNTQVEMKFGQTLMLAGLISSRQSAETQKIPFLGELPYIGLAFSRRRHDNVETEVVITVTPELVAPLDEGQLPPGGPGGFSDAPTDRELGLYGLIEIPKYGEHCDKCQPSASGPYVVPGLKNSGMLAPPAGPAATPDRNELILPAPAPSSDETRLRSNTSTVANRRPSNSNVQQAGFDSPSSAANVRATDARRTSDPTTETRQPAPSARSRPASQSPSPSSTSSPRKSTTPANKPAGVGRNGKPGLIEPAFR
jgi:pilus assembly protein CpaC